MGVEEIGVARDALGDIRTGGSLAIQTPVEREDRDPRRVSFQHADIDLRQARHHIRLANHHANRERPSTPLEDDIGIPQMSLATQGAHHRETQDHRERGQPGPWEPGAGDHARHGMQAKAGGYRRTRERKAPVQRPTVAEAAAISPDHAIALPVKGRSLNRMNLPAMSMLPM